MTERSLRALVLEDERPARNYLVELLHDTELVSVVAAVGSAEQAHAALDEEPPLGVDVAFVDVRLAGDPRSDAGIAWLREVRARAEPPRFVLTTASPEHALTGYELGVVDYLLKPFTAERVEQCVKRLVQTATPRKSAHVPRIVARDGRSLVFMRLEETWAFEAEQRLAFVHGVRGRFDLDLSLSAVEVALASAPLLRVHRNWLVHVPNVLGLERDGGETILVVGTPEAANPLRVPVARERVTEVRDRLVDASVGLRRT